MSWQQLLSICREAADDLRDQKTQRPTACPDDGEPLISGPDGTLFCRFCGWTDRG